MKLGNLFKAVVKTATLPAVIAADVLTGLPRTAEGEDLYTKKAIESIADDLNEFTE